MKRAIDEMI